MADSVEQQFHDSRRLSDCSFFREKLVGTHDYGEQSLLWENLSFLYTLSLQKKGEKTEHLYLAFLERDSPRVYIISSKQFDYRKLLHFLRKNKESLDFLKKCSELQLLLHKDYSRESAEEFYPLLVVTFANLSNNAFIDITIRDFLKGGTSFVPKKKNIREIIDYRLIVEQHSLDPLYQEKDQGEQQIRLKEWEKGEIIDDRYVVEDVFKGGMGIVYRARDIKTSDLYAIKMFQERFLWNKKVTEMFLQEAQVWIELEKNEHIVQALFVKNYQGCPALFLEYVEGSDLEKELAKGKLDILQATDLAIQFCAGMTYATEKLGIIHRDIKPSNCLVDKTGENWILKITDFGLVKMFEEDTEEGMAIQEMASDKAREDTTTRGTFAYMAPECFKTEKEIDTRADMYSFGIMFYEMLTGAKPFHGKNIMEYMKFHSQVKPIDPVKLNPEIPRNLANIVLCCLEKDPSNRFRNFRELMQTLQDVYEELTGTKYQEDESSIELTVEEWSNKAFSLAALGRHEEAIFSYEKALEKSPRDANLWYKKGDSLVALSRLKEAIRCYDRAVLSDHRMSGAWVSKGDVYFQLQNYELAILCYNNALKVNPDNDVVWIKKGFYANLTGKFQEAIECGDKALKINPKLAEGWYVKARGHFALDQLHDAMQCAIKALEGNPIWSKAWSLLALIYAKMRFYEDAIKSFEKYIKLNPGSVRAIHEKAKLQLKACLFDDAIVSFDEVLKVEPENVEVLDMKSRCLLIKGENVEALKCIEQILKKSPGHPGALIKKGIIMEDLLYLDEAKQYYESALKALPEDPLIKYLIEGLAINKRLNDEAILRLQQEFEENIRFFMEDIRLPAPEEEKEKGMFGILRKKKMETPEELKYAAIKAFENGEYVIALNHLSKYLSINKDDGKIWELAGDALHRIGTPEEMERAIDCYKMAIKCSPGNLYLWSKLLNYLENQPGKNLHTLTCLRQNILLLPHDMGLKLKELALLQEIGFTRLAKLKALTLLHNLEASQEDAETLKNKGYLLSLLGRFNEAVKFFDAALAINSRDTMALVQKGDILARTGNKQAALKCFLTASKYSPGDPKIFYFQGITYEELDDLDKAIKSYEVALNYDSEYEMPLVRIGFCLYKKGKVKESMDYYNKVLEKNSHVAHAWEAKGLVMAIQGNYLEAEWCFNKALQEEGADISVLKNKALLLSRMERFSDSIKVLGEIIALDPLQYEAWVMKAECLFFLDEMEEAVNCCNRAIEISPLRADAWVNKGFLFTRAGRFELALSLYNRALELEQHSSEAYLDRGVNYCLMNDHDGSVADYKIALKLDEKFALAWYNKGLCYIHMQDLDESMRCFDMAIQCDSTFADAWVERGLIQISLKLYNEAKALGESASKIDPRNHRAFFLMGLASAPLASKMDETCDSKIHIEAHRDALKSYEKCLRLNEEYIPALVAKRDSLKILDRHQEALDCHRRAAKLIERQGRTPSDDLREEIEVSHVYNTPQGTPVRYEFSMDPHRHALFLEKSMNLTKLHFEQE